MVVVGSESWKIFGLCTWDTISVPTRRDAWFSQRGPRGCYLMAILCDTDAGRVTWPSELLEKARQRGLRLDAEGNVIKVYAATSEQGAAFSRGSDSEDDEMEGLSSR
jgi:hypothetical protein